MALYWADSNHESQPSLALRAFLGHSGIGHEETLLTGFETPEDPVAAEAFTQSNELPFIVKSGQAHTGLRAVLAFLCKEYPQ